MVCVGTTVIKHAPPDIMGKTVLTNADVTKHRYVIICADAYKNQLQPTTQMLSNHCYKSFLFKLHDF